MRWTAIHLLVVTAGGVYAVPALLFRQQDTVYNAQRVEGIQGNGERGYLQRSIQWRVQRASIGTLGVCLVQHGGFVQFGK
jgi:hypothetical protein